jgi:hypothetical protein
VETLFCYILPKICLEITKKKKRKRKRKKENIHTQNRKDLKKVMCPAFCKFYVPLASLVHQRDSTDVLFGNLAFSSTPVVAGLSTVLPEYLLLHLCHHLGFELKSPSNL